MASPNLSEIITTTLRKRNKKLADNVSNHNALFNRLAKKGKIKMIDGGRSIVEELEYAENSTFQYYSGYEALNISPSDVITAAEFHWKQAAVTVSIDGLTRRTNSGTEAILDLLEKRIKNAEKTFKNNLSVGCYSDGTGTSSKQIGGLQLLIADDPTTGTVGGINRATYSFWQNQVYDFSANSATASATTIQAAMNALWLDTCRGNDKADLIVSGTTYWTYYLSSLQANQRFSSEEMASAGFTSLKFMDADVVFDSADSGLSATRMYFLNTDYIYLKAHNDAFMTPLENRNSLNQDADVVPLIFQGNMTMSNAARQGVICP